MSRGPNPSSCRGIRASAPAVHEHGSQGPDRQAPGNGSGIVPGGNRRNRGSSGERASTSPKSRGCTSERKWKGRLSDAELPCRSTPILVYRHCPATRSSGCRVRRRRQTSAFPFPRTSHEIALYNMARLPISLPRNPANSNPHEFPRHSLTIIDDSYSASVMGELEDPAGGEAAAGRKRGLRVFARGPLFIPGAGLEFRRARLPRP